MKNPMGVRKRCTSAERARLLKAYRQSDLTQREFASANDISVSCLAQWLRKARSEESALAVPAFIQVPGGLPVARVPRTPLRIQFPGGHSVEIGSGFRAEELAQICHIVGGL